ncbi:hypothetical protein [Geobacillus subterraneus]|uniref:Uncharacterized protein n=1 Tax=Geobacillus subterraneus TaxID=129338 RepID=A0A679FQE0_9BACL|nr:hypothetical protein [Geobacillus subterraneus]BBW98872.1 hypothetical protein GsuE55_37050 [Geobacillus subterraneus]
MRRRCKLKGSISEQQRDFVLRQLKELGINTYEGVSVETLDYETMRSLLALLRIVME